MKRLRHPELGAIALERSSFAVDGRLDLRMIVYNPATPEDRTKVEDLIVADGRPVSRRGEAVPALIRRARREAAQEPPSLAS